ncbi:DUF6259 domain-containing protein [Paenibacillus nasutitermitis]|uniref:DUF6259 domain-containing protein n=1 Tax=Paenibacillus nasutitermitis TaxID=1652958 RepID=A0A916Z5V5_9BACL|nr:DUF6259 domain-containing protein [Paenibacillus nasutitermitis]GGD77277.1 hypothetical protein GCM10010911_39110 [Paenibacillus nasutitermitis]
MNSVIRNRYVELVFDDEQGTVTSMRNLTTEDEYIKHDVPYTLFMMNALEGLEYGNKIAICPGLPSAVRVNKEHGMQSLVIEYHNSADGAVQFHAEVRIELAEDSREFVWCMTLDHNDPQHRIVEVLFPCIKGISLGESREDDVLIYPHHGGEKTLNPVSAYASEKYAGFWRAQTIRETYGFSREINYCGLASMSWMYLYDEQNGLYVGSHDERFPVTGLRVETGGPDDPWMGFGFRKYVEVGTGKSWSSGPACMALTDQDWHWGAKRYRTWIDQHIEIHEHPAYLQDQYILNQCYNFKRSNEIQNRFVNIPAMFDEGKTEFGMDHMFIASWNRKGFDTDYPEFQPDMELGTPWELYEGCKYISEQGGIVTFYINARIFNVDSDFYPTLGKRWAIRDHSGEMMKEEYGPLEFVVNCPSHQEWIQYLLDMSRWMVRSYGAAGIYLDQLGSADPYPCYNPHHSHANIGEFNTGYVQLLRELLPQIKQMNPDSFLMIENCGDIYGGYVWGNLTWNGEKYDEFFDLYKYTFPEYVQVNMVNPRRGLTDEEQEHQLHWDMSRAILLGSVLWLGMDKYALLNEEMQQFVQRSVSFRKRLQPLFRDGLFVDNEGIKHISERITVSVWQLNSGGHLYVIANPSCLAEGQFILNAQGRDSAELEVDDLDGNRRIISITAADNQFRIAVPGVELSSVVLRLPQAAVKL